MKNRQANNLAYQSRELWRRSVRISGLYMKFYRETFWNLGIFYATPQMSQALQRHFPSSNPWVQQVAAATITGCAIGFVTTPIAGIKTVIQASPENLSIFQAIQKITRAQRPVLATQQLWAGACSWMGYLSIGMCMMNLVYQHLPTHLPHLLKHQ